MDRVTFINELKAALASRVNSQVVTENINYYEEYINTEVRKGRNEDEVITGLGDPRLLARNIADAEKRAAASSEYEGSEEYIYEDADSGENGGPKVKVHHVPLRLVILIVVLVLVLILAAVFSILSVLLPVIIPVACVVLIFRLVRRSGWL